MFVDVDYKDLICKKRDVVRQTSELNGFLSNLEFPEGDDIILQSDQYVQIGCDLRELGKLSQSLAKIAQVENSVVLCTAEVSITYMSIEAADALIEWVGSFPDGTVTQHISNIHYN